MSSVQPLPLASVNDCPELEAPEPMALEPAPVAPEPVALEPVAPVAPVALVPEVEGEALVDGLAAPVAPAVEPAPVAPLAVVPVVDGLLEAPDMLDVPLVPMPAMPAVMSVEIMTVMPGSTVRVRLPAEAVADDPVVAPLAAEPVAPAVALPVAEPLAPPEALPDMALPDMALPDGVPVTTTRHGAELVEEPLVAEVEPAPGFPAPLVCAWAMIGMDVLSAIAATEANSLLIPASCRK